MRRVAWSALVLAVCSVGVSVGAQGGAPPAAPAAAPNDYAQDAAWLCRPGRHDACDTDLTTTVVAGDGTLTREPWSARPDASIDCFYVYPTVSTDPGPNSDMTADPAELTVAAVQFARFASVCRPFAPLYRQVTLAGLSPRIAGDDIELGTGLPYDDVRDAWHDYLKRDNRGRGVVLIGHSQGAYVLTELLRRDIEGTPAQKQLVSAVLTGTTVTVPRGARTGGTFTSLAACQSAAETGCLIVYSTYRSTHPPPANALFGRARTPGHESVCTNPAGLSDAPADLHPYLATTGRMIALRAQPQPWVAGKTIDTPWVSVPGLVSARCATNEHATYLEITIKGNPADPRADDVVGDIGPPGKPMANWGLHLIDLNLAQGDLLALIDRQARAWASRRQ